LFGCGSEGAQAGVPLPLVGTEDADGGAAVEILRRGLLRMTVEFFASGAKPKAHPSRTALRVGHPGGGIPQFVRNDGWFVIVPRWGEAVLRPYEEEPKSTGSSACATLA
jgi:hypothetical protein